MSERTRELAESMLQVSPPGRHHAVLHAFAHRSSGTRVLKLPSDADGQSAAILNASPSAAAATLPLVSAASALDNIVSMSRSRVVLRAAAEHHLLGIDSARRLARWAASRSVADTATLLRLAANPVVDAMWVAQTLATAPLSTEERETAASVVASRLLRCRGRRLGTIASLCWSELSQEMVFGLRGRSRQSMFDAACKHQPEHRHRFVLAALAGSSVLWSSLVETFCELQLTQGELMKVSKRGWRIPDALRVDLERRNTASARLLLAHCRSLPVPTVRRLARADGSLVSSLVAHGNLNEQTAMALFRYADPEERTFVLALSPESFRGRARRIVPLVDHYGQVETMLVEHGTELTPSDVTSMLRRHGTLDMTATWLEGGYGCKPTPFVVQSLIDAPGMAWRTLAFRNEHVPATLADALTTWPGSSYLERIAQPAWNEPLMRALPLARLATLSLWAPLLDRVLREQHGDDPVVWEAALSLADGWDGTVAELVDAAAALSR